MGSRGEVGPRKRVVVYCQHLSGAGHYVRSREIVRALARRHDVHFMTGGRSVPGPGLNNSVRLVQLPTIYRTSQGLLPVDATRTIAEVFAERQRMLDRELRAIRPDVLIIEHFPFSKWDLRSELLGAISTARAANPHVQVLSSVRDHPAGHEAACSVERFRSEVVTTLNEHFSALLVHSDPRVVRLESQFPWVRDISVPIHYTGYVSEKGNEGTPHFELPANNLDKGYVLVSSGGLVDGFRLANLCSAAWQRLHQSGATAGRRMVILAGLFAEESQYERLERTLRDGPFHLRRFSDEFLPWMQAAGLSISQGGYNTTMNVLETRTRAILAPNRRTSDQPLRARNLAELGVVDIIDPEVIKVEEMADRIMHGLSRPRPQHNIALDGAERTLDVIEAL